MGIWEVKIVYNNIIIDIQTVVIKKSLTYGFEAILYGYVDSLFGVFDNHTYHMDMKLLCMCMEIVFLACLVITIVT